VCIDYSDDFLPRTGRSVGRDDFGIGLTTRLELPQRGRRRRLALAQGRNGELGLLLLALQ
jgi:hypothetical protein